MTTLTNLLDFDLPQLTDWVQSLGERPFRARQIFRWIHREGCEDFAAMSDVAKSLRAKLEEQAIIAAPRVLRDSVSRDGTRKWLLDVGGGNAVETVFIPERSRGTLCVSTQAGCALECAFCSTGKQGFNRNLGTAEILGQLLEALPQDGLPLAVLGHSYGSVVAAALAAQHPDAVAALVLLNPICEPALASAQRLPALGAALFYRVCAVLPEALGPGAGLRVVGAHTDSPALKLKPAAALDAPDSPRPLIPRATIRERTAAMLGAGWPAEAEPESPR